MGNEAEPTGPQRTQSLARTMKEHPDRAAILSELHARPFVPVTAPCRVYHFAFLVSAEQARADRADIAALALARGLKPPPEGAKFHRLELGDWSLRWESHTEFSTYTWTTTSEAEHAFAKPDPVGSGEIAFTPHGQLMAAVHMAIVAEEPREDQFAERHRSMLCVVDVSDGSGRLKTDFLADEHGYTRFLIEAWAMSATRAGRIAQRVLELETYRVLALLGLPEARRISPELTQMESELDTLTQAIGSAQAIDENHRLLERLTGLAARIEAQTAATAFRFGATRAYYALVKNRIEMIGERRVGENVSIAAFLGRRFGPAMDTCTAVEARQSRLSAQIARAADLLRTRIQFELEQQNRDLLSSMNRRARLQLRLQETVEGLSIAAISYYVVGLIGYVAKGAKESHLTPRWLTPDIVAGISVPFVMVGLWLMLKRARAAWARDDGGEHDA